VLKGRRIAISQQYLPKGHALNFQIPFGEQLLQSGILAFEFLQPCCIQGIHATICTAPTVKGGFTNRMLAT
jgi:hypothetical protein